MEDKIRYFINNAVYGDSLRYSKTNHVLEKKKIKGQWSYIVELFIITVKSLIPSMDVEGTTIGYTRFKEEIKLWTSYRHGSNKLLINSVNKFDDKIYWIEIDDSVYARIFPIVAANTQWDVILSEVIKNILFTTGNIFILQECIVLSKILYLILNGKKDYDKIISSLKEEIIQLSQKELIGKYNKYFKADIAAFPGNFVINFERARIELLNLFNGKLIKNNFYILSRVLDILRGDIKEFGQIQYNFFLYGVLGLIIQNNNEFIEYKDKNFIQSLANYLLRLRKSRINPESLYIKDYYVPDVFKYNVGEEFSHSLLNKCKVVNKEETEKLFITYINTKTGIYRFFKFKNPV
ncbi:hypothetical protein TR13x_09075 [Caloranaerobacter sp. TR13]|uniref:hypothetical protein n=1 Tax=Caloranaerobacter sp. TR13 TaxID=1302151 RepID=UPI0006D44A00|nr:hypothetical protein [Caloranaerobacter sp. TR13]KPU26635.1 hypothetical protein TR13x_09075 [Caloranaerobacter sp. TR13]